MARLFRTAKVLWVVGVLCASSPRLGSALSNGIVLGYLARFRYKSARLFRERTTSGLVWTQMALLLGQNLLEQGDRLGGTPCDQVRSREVVARVHGVRMTDAPVSARGRPESARAGVSPRRFGRHPLQAAARLFRAAKVLRMARAQPCAHRQRGSVRAGGSPRWRGPRPGRRWLGYSESPGYSG